MSRPISRLLRAAVIGRAKNRCEYCGLSQAGQEAAFHIDHVKPIASGGTAELENLALACVSCSLRKGARLVGPDPETGRLAPLFHPRRDSWLRHFRWDGIFIKGMTPTGRATITLLNLNRALILDIREEEVLRHRHPPR